MILTVSHSEFERLVPKPILPTPEQFIPIEKFVQDAILSRHVGTPPTTTNVISSSLNTATTTTTTTGVATYKALLDLLRSGVEEDPYVLSQVLLAIMYNNQGIPLKCIASQNERHKTLLHYIFRINPLSLPKNNKSVIVTSSAACWEALRQDTCITNPISNTITDLNLMDIYLHFLVTLVSANSTFLSSTLETLWKLLLQDTCQVVVDVESNEVGEGGQDDKQQQQELQKHDISKVLSSVANIRSIPILKLHTTIAKILHLVPKGKTELYSIISSSFPYKLAPIQRQVSYLQQTLVSIHNYLSTSHASFLELWVDKCLEMDVEIRIEDNGQVKLQNHNTNTSLQDGNQLEGNHDNNNNNDEEKKEDTLQQELLNHEIVETSLNHRNHIIEKVDEMANKLDEIMLILFQHIFDSSQSLSPQIVYTMILPSFNSMILTTHRSKFVQFIFFLVCGLDADIQSGVSWMTTGQDPQSTTSTSIPWTLHQSSLFRDFTAKLLDIAFDINKDTTTRQSAVGYLASFLSRASYINAETVCETVSTLLQFTEIYMDRFPNEASVRNAWKTSPSGTMMIMMGSPLLHSGDRTRDMVDMHSLFYTVSQAIFYIMCFRGKECLQYYKQARMYHEQQPRENTISHDGSGSFAEPETVNVSSERWNRLCSHHLQPLRFCLETVRGEFLLLAHSFHLLDGSLLERLIMEDRKMATPMESLGSTVSPKIKKKATSIRTAATLEKSRLNGGVGGLGRGSNPLQSFFPFDPYLLCKSHKFIEKYYKHWAGSSVPDDEDDYKDEDSLEKCVEVTEEDDALNEEHSYDDDDDDNETETADSTSSDDDDDDVDSQTDRDEYLDTFPEDSWDTVGDRMSKAHSGKRQRPRVESIASNTDYSDISASKRPRFGSMNSYTDASDPGASLSREAWVQELKRSRAMSITDECW